MPTQAYKNARGERLPSVTTIISKFRDPGPLMYWSWAQGRDGKDYRQERDNAANAGTLAHALAEADIRGTQVDLTSYPQDIVTKARSAFAAYREWREQTRLMPVETELPLVSERYQFGGTMDLMLTNNRLTLGDIKTSGAIYGEHLIQVAAYSLLWEEHHPDRPVEGFHILRFSKEHGDFSHHFFANLDEAKEAFLCMRRLYEITITLKKRAA